MIPAWLLAILSGSGPLAVVVGGEGEVDAAVQAALERRLCPPYLDRDAYDRHDVGRSTARCGLDHRCLAGELRAAGAGLGLFVDVALDTGLVAVMLIDPQQTSPISATTEAFTSTASSAISTAVERVLQTAGFPLAGRIHFDLSPPEAHLRFVDSDGELSDRVPTPAAKLAAGAYRARARLEGYADQEIEFRIDPGGERRISILLEPPPLYESPWLWTGVGAVAVAAIVTTVVLAVTLQPKGTCVCLETEPNACADLSCR